MSDQERYAQYVAEYENLCHRLGFQVAAQSMSEVQGEIILIRARTAIVPLANWQPPKDPAPADTGADSKVPAPNGKRDEPIGEKVNG